MQRLEPGDGPAEGIPAPTDSGLLLVVWKRSKSVGADKRKAIADELKLFEATWRFVTIETEEAKVPPDRFQEDRLILKGKQFTSNVQGNTTEGVYKINPTATPRRST